MSASDGQQIRHRQASHGIELARRDVDSDVGSASFVAKIVADPDSSTWPPTDGFTPVQAVVLTGGYAVGSTLTANVYPGVFDAKNLRTTSIPNPATAPRAMYVLCTTVNGKSYFEY